MAAEREAERQEAYEILRKAEEAKKILAAMNMEEENQRMGNNDTHRLSAGDVGLRWMKPVKARSLTSMPWRSTSSDSESEPEEIKKVSQFKFGTK